MSYHAWLLYVCFMSIHMLGSKWGPLQKNTIFINQMFLEECREFWKIEGNVREFRQEHIYKP